MKALICGGRDFNDSAFICLALDKLHEEYNFTSVIQGGAKGADSLAKMWAESRLINCETFPAEWRKYGPAAGPIRNQKMLDENPDIVIGFSGGNGTMDMMMRARKKGTETVYVKYEVD